MGFLAYQKSAISDEESGLCEDSREWKEKRSFYKS